MKESWRILDIDPRLTPYKGDIELRMYLYQEVRARLVSPGDPLSSIANGHLYYGFHRTPEGWVYREWAPNAEEIALIGEFNDWDNSRHTMLRQENGDWVLKVPGEMPHGSKVRIRMKAGERVFDRIPLYCKRVVQDPVSKSFDGVIWNPPEAFVWQNDGLTMSKPLYIYECHIGMSGEKEGITTFAEFADQILPRIKRLGYTAIQIMAIMEHPFYGSFGYQVSNFFAVSSRFGTPEDLKMLVDRAHGMGIAVIMDLVHSHIVKNTTEGLAEFDGTEYQFCHAGGKGTHREWNTQLFNYGKQEVLHFLLSNVKYWITEYHLDGFRFDGVTSMLYHHHGMGDAFDDMRKYFSMDTDVEAVTYLQLAAELAKEINPDCIMIAEDMSAMPGMCLPLADGGIGFDYRLNMGLPDYLIKLMKTRDEDWFLGSLWYELTNRRPGEKVIGYTESHDQALVGDKTLMFWLADQDMYWHMSKSWQNDRIDRAIALHKMLRLITCAAGGEGYLNFMGNEFGHPEWVDFPREGNSDSYKYARRQWSLADDPNLRYGFLQDFDQAMLSLLAKQDLIDKPANFLKIHEDDKILAFTKGDYVFLFNFHPTNAYFHKLDFTGMSHQAHNDSNCSHGMDEACHYKLIFHSAWERFGGFVDETRNEGLLHSDYVVVDHRTAMVVKLIL